MSPVCVVFKKKKTPSYRRAQEWMWKSSQGGGDFSVWVKKKCLLVFFCSPNRHKERADIWYDINRAAISRGGR